MNGKSVTIGLLAGATNDAYAKSLLDGVLEVTKKANARLVCYTCANLPSNIELDSFPNRIFDLVDFDSIDALIITGTLSHNVTKESFQAFCRRFMTIPVVTVSVQVDGIPAVVTEDAQAVRDLMAHLLDDHGYRRIAYIGGPRGQQEAEARKSVFLEQMALRSIPVRDAWIEHGDFSFDSGVRAMERLLSDGVPLFEGIVSANDMMALGAQHYLETNGYRVPKNLFLVGYDDYPTMSLTTVHQGTFHQARRAAELVFQLLWGETVPEVSFVASRLVIRSSCGCAGSTRADPGAAGRVGSEYAEVWSRLEPAFSQSIANLESRAFLVELQAILDEGQTVDLGMFWNEVLAHARLQALANVHHGVQLDDVEKLLGLASLLIAESATSRESQIAFHTEDRARRLKAASESLMNSLTISDVTGTLDQSLPEMGISGCWLSLFDDPAQRDGTATLVLAIEGGVSQPLVPDECRFPSGLVRPGGLKQARPEDSLLIVGVLYTRHDLLGVVLFASDSEGSQVCDALRSQISGAIRGVQLWEERLRSENLIIQSEKMAALGNLVAGVAHEINTPVGIGVTAASDLRGRGLEITQLYRSGQLSRSQFDIFFEFLEQESKLIEVNLLKAANLIRSFKQIAVDQSHESSRRFKLAAYLRDIVVSLNPQLKPAGHLCTVDCPENLELVGPPGSLAQIFGNLIGNSVFHGFEGRRNGHMTISVQSIDGRVRMKFSDDGRGIAADVLGRVFEPFFTTKLGQGGSGLGLHIVYNQVVQVWNGTITCHSDGNSGTTFVVEIPEP